jgi:hypothetical protein
MRKHIIVMLIVSILLVAGQIPAVLAQEEATPAASPPPTAEFVERIQSGEICAWPIKLDVEEFDVGFPDVNSAYYLIPYALSPGESIIVEGTYPFARFSSIVTYYRDPSAQGTGLELLGWLPDYAIAPDPGSANPAVDPNATDDPAQRRWTVEVTGTASASSEPTVSTPVAGKNMLPAMPANIENAIGVMILRLYVPSDPPEDTGAVDLPTLTLRDESGGSRTLTECTEAERDTWETLFMPLAVQIIEEAPALPVPPSVDAPPEWVQTTFPGLGTNPDNRYLMTPIAWEPGRIVVVRGQAPTFPDTNAGDTQTKPSELRYWTFCTGSNVIPLITASCVGDFEMPIGANGMYTIVVSLPEDQPANATMDEGVAWMQGGDATQPELLFLRHLLPSEDFYGQSAWAVPEGVIGAAEEIMGPYYPQLTYCDTATFEEGGAEACFANSATPAAES